MACGGFTCSKNSLIALNVLYILVAFILIGVASYGRTANYVTNVKIVGGIIACGVFLLFIAILGILGATKHNQVFLFFYMIVLFILFLLQFGFACACLAVTDSQQTKLLRTGWENADNETKNKAQTSFGCCGFDTETQGYNVTQPMGHPSCVEVEACKCEKSENDTCCYDLVHCQCVPCLKELKNKFSTALKASGGIGLFFSFTELVGMVISFRYRRMAGASHVTLT